MAVDITEDVEITEINASLERGGWECRFVSLRDTDLANEAQQVIIQLQGAFGGPPGALRNAFKGYVMPVRAGFDRVGSRTEYIAQTSDGFLRKGWLQGLGLRDRDTTARDHYHQWDSVTGAGVRLTMGRIIQHIMGFYDNIGNPPASNPDWVAHTNFVYHATENPHGWITLDEVETAPFDAATNPDGTMRVDEINVQATDNLWTRLRELARFEFFELLFDKTDTLHYHRHPMFQSTLPTPVMTFDEDFYIEQPLIEFRDTDLVRAVALHAFQDDGDTLHAVYPAQNVVLNPSIEVNTDGWTAAGGAAIARSGAQAYEGSYSLEITPSGAIGDGAYYSAAPNVANTLFTNSIWVWTAVGAAVAVRIRVRDVTNGTETASGGAVLPAATWTQLTVNHTTGANPCTDLRLYIETTNATANVFYADAAILSPPSSPYYRGRPDITRLRCNSQSTLNDWAMRHWHFLTRPYTVTWTAAGPCALLFELLDRVYLTISGTTANGLHVDWTDEPFWIHKLSYRPQEGFSGVSTFQLEAENLLS